VALRPTASQTVGPYFHIGLPWEDGPRLVPADHPGAIRLFGTVTDGEGEPVGDALIEIWQADEQGRYEHPSDGFEGFGRCETDERGRYAFTTVKPGSEGHPHAPHIAVSVFARGLLSRLVTRVYFPDEEDANAADPLLSSIDDEAARATLVAVAEDDGLRFDISLQGEGETAFLDV
jgi:protocatechuate 3,4-dioxygenase alpha subunit